MAESVSRLGGPGGGEQSLGEGLPGVSVELLEARFNMHPFPYVKTRDYYPELDDEQYRTIAAFQDIMFSDFVPIEDSSSGQIVTPQEVRHNYMLDMQDQVADLPDFARIGLLGFPLTALQEVSLTERHNQCNDLGFMREYFQVSQQTVRQLTAYYVDKQLELTGPVVDDDVVSRRINWPFMAWAHESFPDLVPVEKLHAFCGEPNPRSALSRLVARNIYLEQDEEVGVVATVFDMPPDFIRSCAWESFLRNKLSVISVPRRGRAGGVIALTELIPEKYLQYFPDTADLIAEVQGSLNELQAMLESEEIPSSSTEHKQAIRALRLIEASAQEHEE